MPNMSQETYTWDNLFAGSFDVITQAITLISGQNLTRGSLLGKITASGKYTLSLTASSDGSETPVAILAEDKDASTGDAVTSVYISGEFNERQVTFGTGHTANSTRDGLRDLNIYLKNTVAQ